ncbi:MAG: helix-turn-helix domain-containing protein [Spirochaetota bacterium]
MESIGARFRETREAKGYTLEQVARDTHIARRFLEALEDEDFSVFPGEPYLFGFMRTYSTYLGLDAEETANLYYNLKLQEQPPPIDELISKGPSVPVGRIVAIAIGVVVLGAGAYFLIFTDLLAWFGRAVAEQPPSVETEEPEEPEGRTFEMLDEIVEQRFTQGDRILVPVGDDEYPLDLAQVGNGITLDLAGTERQIGVGEQAVVDVNGDDQSDLRIIVRSVDTLDTPPTAVMRFDRGAAAAAVDRPTIQEPAGDAVDTPAVGSTLEPTRSEGARLIAAFDEREEFVVEVRFEGYALFRYQADDEPRVEEYYQAGDTIRTSVRERFQLWVSNAASARLRVAGQDVSLGDPGEVTAGLIAWVRDPESERILLELIPVY